MKQGKAGGLFKGPAEACILCLLLYAGRSKWDGALFTIKSNGNEFVAPINIHFQHIHYTFYNFERFIGTPGFPFY